MKTYKIKGCVSSNEVIYREFDKNHEFPVYPIIADVDLGTHEFNNLTEAKEWFEYNYPALVPGGSIHQIDPDNPCPDFCCYAVKGFDGHWGVDDIHSNIRV